MSSRTDEYKSIERVRVLKYEAYVFKFCILSFVEVDLNTRYYNISDVIKIHCNCTVELSQVLNFIWGGSYSYIAIL